MNPVGTTNDLFGRLTPPFVLLEDRLAPASAARLYRDPLAIVWCDDPAGVDAALRDIEAGLARGLHAAGLFAYELGYALEPRLAALMPRRRDTPLLWFGLFEQALPLAADDLDEAFATLGPPPPINAVRMGHDRAVHRDKVRQVLSLIAEGDIYQANLTFPLDFHYAGDPLALYGALRASQPAAHGGVLALEDRTILSVSPELWVRTANGQAVTRPMKGTAARESDPQADRAAGAGLAADPKQRAENLMIVDLLRNDLARIAEPGSVRAPALFSVETYPSFHALTSTISARLRPGVGLRERVAALFPCGSIVGAPKIRAAEVIRNLEAEPRGAYTGGLGSITPGRDMDFNVAIRTAVINARGEGRYGVGGGIVADSDPDAEYDEALLKARIITGLTSEYSLIETFRWSPKSGFIRLRDHLDRLERSAGQLAFAFDRARTEAELMQLARAWSAACAKPSTAHRRVRLLLTRVGALTITAEPLAEPLSRPLRVGLAEARIDAGDAFLRHKTTRRDLHDRAFAHVVAQGLDEALLLNRQGRVCDASRNSVFVRFGADLVTPPAHDGALPGVLRAKLIAEGRVSERPLTPGDLRRATAWFLGNSLHGLRQAELAVGAL